MARSIGNRRCEKHPAAEGTGSSRYGLSPAALVHTYTVLPLLFAGVILMVPVCRAGEDAEREAKIYLRVGISEQESGNIEGAEEAFRQALAVEPGLLEAGFRLGRLLYEANRHKEAFQTFNGLIEARRESAESRPALFLWAGMTAWHAGEYEKTIEYLQPLIDDEEQGALARAYTAAAYSSLGREDEAAEILPRDFTVNTPPHAGPAQAEAGSAIRLSAGYDSNVPSLFAEKAAPSGASARLSGLFATDFAPGEGWKFGLSGGYIFFPSLEDRSRLHVDAALRRRTPGRAVRLGVDYGCRQENSGSRRHLVTLSVAAPDPPDDVLVRGPEWSLAIGGRMSGDGDGSATDDLWWSAAYSPRLEDGRKVNLHLVFEMSFARDSQYTYMKLDGVGSFYLGGGLMLELAFIPQRFLGETDRNDAEVSASLVFRKSMGERQLFEAGIAGIQSFSTDPAMEYDRLTVWLSWSRLF